MAVFFDIFFRGNSTSFEAASKKVLGSAKQIEAALSGAIGRQLENYLGAAAVAEVSRKVVNFADDITDLSDRLGVSTKHLQEWGYAAKTSGSSAETVTKFFEKLGDARQKALEGDQGALRSFAQLGVKESDLRNKNIYQIGMQVGNSVKSNSNPQNLISSLREVGGKNAGELIPAMQEGMDVLAKKANDAGAVLDDKLLESVKALKDQFEGIGFVIMGPIATALGYFRARIADVMDLTKITVGGLATAAGTLAGGGTLSEAWKAFQKNRGDVVNDRAKMEAAIEKRGQDRADAKEAKYANTREPKTDVSGGNTLSGGGGNNWQKLGAATRWAPDLKQITILEQIRGYSEQTAKAVERVAEIEASMYRGKGAGSSWDSTPIPSGYTFGP